MNIETDSALQDGTAKPHRFHLFVLKLWLEDLGDGKAEWRGDIQHLATREKCYFREWNTLLDFLQRSSGNAQLQAPPAGNLPTSNGNHPNSE